jgi:hypothetical protein
MARVIADGEVKINWVTTIANTSAPTTTEIGAGTELTPWLSSLSTPLEGDAVDASDLSSAFNKSVAGTYGGGATATLYRDDTSDDAYDLFPRNTTGYLVIRRFGGSDVAWASADEVEVWNLRVITRSPVDMDRNNVQMFTVDFATLDEPVLDATVA